MQRMMDLKELNRMLAERIDILVPQILSNAVREGHEWRVGSIYNEAGRSLGIHRSGARQGVWKDFSADHLAGDTLDLVTQVCCGGDKKRAVAWARIWLGVDRMDPRTFEVARRAAGKAYVKAQRAAAREVERKKRIARGIWHGASAYLSGSPVERYLSGRGIALKELAKIPRVIRFDPECYCNENGAFYPAMVAAVVGAEGKLVAVHRTYLEEAGGSVKKARLREAKKVLGPYMGGHIPLARGKSGKPLKNAPADDVVVLCEGIEDGLSIALACPDYRVLACISVGNFRNIHLPPQIGRVMIAADNDAPGSPAAKALSGAIETLADQGRDVFVARAPAEKDFNDLLQSGGKRDVRACQ